MMTKEVDIEARVAKARELFRGGYNCAQSVAMAYVDLFDGVDPDIILTASAPFGGGMGRLREVCGAVSGMSMIAGFLIPVVDPADRESKSRNYALVQSLAEAFRAQNRYIVCRDLLGLTTPKDDPTPSERTEEYYRKRPCADLVADAARILGEAIVKAGE